MSEMIAEERSHSPGTPPPPPAPTDERFMSPTAAENCSRNDEMEETPSKSRGKKRHRRAKGKKKKQKTNLMITNEDGTNSTEASKKQKKVFLRPSKNPLLNAPKNSTQFIMDDHENSNLFWNFDSNRCNETSKDDIESVGEESNDGMEAAIAGGDDDSFWSAYLERDFESVYETAHQEEIYSWNRTRIIDEISTLEKRQKQLIAMLSQIDPMIYLQKLQHELLALQEQNRQLKLVNVAERQERERRRGSSSPRMPDSTTIENSDTTEDDSSSSSSDDDTEGGCSSGCCLAQPCEDLEERLQDVAEDDQENGDDTQEVVTVSNQEAGDINEEANDSPDEGPGDAMGQQ